MGKKELQIVLNALRKSSPYNNITHDEWKGEAWLVERQSAINILTAEIDCNMMIEAQYSALQFANVMQKINK
jgi:hypothetical protein